MDSEKGCTNKTVETLSKILSAEKIQAEAAFFGEIEFFIETGNVEAFINKEPIKKISTIFFRKVGIYRNEACVLANIALKNKINFLDNLYVWSNEPSKMKQTFTLAFNDVSVPKTYYSPYYDNEKIQRAIEFLKLPVIVKLSRSNRGKGVFLARSEEEVQRILKDVDREAIIQEFIPNEFDYRILVLGGSAAIAEKRIHSEKEEFRNNVSLGAKEEFIEISEIPERIIKLAQIAAKVGNIQVAGVDIVSSGEESYVLEINRTPAFTHTGESSEIKQLANFLIQCEGKNNESKKAN